MTFWPVRIETKIVLVLSAAVLVLVIESRDDAGTLFDHEKLDVDHLALEYVTDSFVIAKEQSDLHRHARDQ